MSRNIAKDYYSYISSEFAPIHSIKKNEMIEIWIKNSLMIIHDLILHYTTMTNIWNVSHYIYTIVSFLNFYTGYICNESIFPALRHTSAAIYIALIQASRESLPAAMVRGCWIHYIRVSYIRLSYKILRSYGGSKTTSIFPQQYI